VVADAVAVEPVSSVPFVLTGKNTGKFSRICPLLLGALAKRADNSRTFDMDSLQNKNRESLESEQGKQSSEQGISSFFAAA
jgi:hypothetical protein